jgi:Flp pilus assembly protein TadG
MTIPANMSRRAVRRTRGERGQAYVEFALILPVLLLLVMGIIQFGNAFRTYITLTDATRVGGRQAAVSLSIQPESSRVPMIEQKMHQAAASLDPDKMTITVDPKDVDGTTAGWYPSGQVTVRASYPFKINLFGIVVFDSKINSRTTERVE